MLCLVEVLRSPKKPFFLFLPFFFVSQSDASIRVKLKINISQLLITFAVGLPASYKCSWTIT